MIPTNGQMTTFSKAKSNLTDANGKPLKFEENKDNPGTYTCEGTDGKIYSFNVALDDQKVSIGVVKPLTPERMKNMSPDLANPGNPADAAAGLQIEPINEKELEKQNKKQNKGKGNNGEQTKEDQQQQQGLGNTGEDKEQTKEDERVVLEPQENTNIHKENKKK